MTTLVPPLCAFFRLAQVFPLLQLSLCDLLASLLLVTSVALYIAERGDVTLCSWLNTVTLVRAKVIPIFIHRVHVQFVETINHCHVYEAARAIFVGFQAAYTSTFLFTLLYAVEVLRRIRVRLANVCSAPKVNYPRATSLLLVAYCFAW